MPTLPVNTLGTGNEDHRLNWVLFELLWRDFFRLVSYVLDTLLLSVPVSQLDFKT